MLVGCYSKEEAEMFTGNSFSHPETVGEIDGQLLYRVQIAREGHEESENHFVYFFKSNPVVTVNTLEPHGKTHILRVVVMVNGHSVTNLIKLEDEEGH